MLIHNKGELVLKENYEG